MSSQFGHKYRGYPLRHSPDDCWEVRSPSHPHTLLHVAETIQDARKWLDEALDGDDVA